MHLLPTKSWCVVMLYVAVALAIFFSAVATGRAETIGYQLTVEACRDGACRPILPSDQLWSGQFTCQAQAEVLERAGRDLPLERIGLVRGTWTIRAHCKPVIGMPSA